MRINFSSVRRIVSILAGSLVLTGVAAHPPQSARAPENAASALIGATVINGTSGPLMSDAIAQMLPAAVGVAISPMPIVAVLLMLVTARGRVNGPAFFMGWWLGISVVGALVFLSAGEIDAAGGGVPLPMAGALELNLGVFLLLMALRQWRGRPHAGEEPAPPKWMRALDRLTPLRAAGAAVLLSAANPKNLLLGFAGAAVIARAGISGGQRTIAFALFALIASLGVGAPVALYFALGERSRRMLDALKGWMARNSAVIMAVLLLAIGARLIGGALGALFTFAAD